MRYIIMPVLCILLLLSACGGSSGGGNTEPVKNVTASASTVTISGQIDLDGATIEGGSDPTVQVDGNAATVTDAGGGVYDWSATVATSSIHDTYRVEYYVNGNLVTAFDYALDP